MLAGLLLTTDGLGTPEILPQARQGEDRSLAHPGAFFAGWGRRPPLRETTRPHISAPLTRRKSDRDACPGAWNAFLKAQIEKLAEAP